jgi:hypothetical protein
MATRKFRKFSEGGEAADKEEGLKTSKGEKVGFLQRMRMGNIDDESSEAYRRFGAGRAKADRDEKNEAAAMKAVDLSRASAAKEETKESSKPSKVEVDELEEANKREPIPVPAGPKAKPDTTAKAAPKTEAKAMPKAEVKAATKTTPKANTSNYSNEGRGSKASGSTGSSKKSLVDQIPLDAPRTPVKGNKADSTELGRNIGNALNATPGIQAVGRMKSAGQAAQKAGSRALSTAVDDGVTFLGKSGRRQVGGFPEVGSSSARQLSNNPTRQLPSPPKQISGPSKSELVSKNRAARAASRKESMDEENAARHGLNRKDPDFDAKASEVRRNLGGDDFTLGMKRGGKVKSSSSSKPTAKGWGMARGARAAKMR